MDIQKAASITTAGARCPATRSVGSTANDAVPGWKHCSTVDGANHGRRHFPATATTATTRPDLGANAQGIQSA